ncbi:MAG: efflux transporter outer membrane subunit [Longimicrobiales bacterium]
MNMFVARVVRARPSTPVGIGLVVLSTAACSLAPSPAEIPAVDRMPDSYATDAETPSHDSADVVSWWRTFEDRTLDALVGAALDSNLDIQEAVARVEEVRAQYRIARSSLFPTVTAGTDASRFSQPANAGQFGAIFGGDDADADPNLPDRPSRFTFSTFGASLGAAYELDFWGRLNSSRRAAYADYLATGADARTVEISVAAETIAGYFELRELVAREAILTEVVDILTERLELTEDRYQRGVVSSIELYQIQQDLNATRAGLPLLGSQITASRGRLAVLLGRYPREVEPLIAGEELPTVSLDPIPAGLPADMLAARPDLVAAAFRLEGSRQRVGERRAARLPSINLTGSTGTQSADLSDIVRADQWFTNFVASLTAPIFAGGRLKADQEAAEARYEQEAARYARSVLTAFQEVDAAIAGFNAQRERKLVVDEQLAVAEASADAALLRVEQGVGDYVGYLDALRTVLNVQDTQASAERELATARLNVHRALGGSWISEPADEQDSEGDLR